MALELKEEVRDEMIELQEPNNPLDYLIKIYGTNPRAVAREVGVSHNTLLSWAKGRSRALDRDKMRRVADLFGVTVDFVFFKTWEEVKEELGIQTLK